MAAACGRPDRMLGFTSSTLPADEARGAIRTITTSDETMDRAFAFVQQLGKEPSREG